MRMLRNIVAALLAAFLVTGLVATASVAVDADARSLPKRIITEQDPDQHQVTYNAFRLKGKVTEPQVDGTELPYANQQVKILKKACGSCKWKTVKKIKTNENGVFKTRIYAPDKGTWRWRSKVDHSNGYGNTKGQIWYLYF
jgi:hypothetical protein